MQPSSSSSPDGDQGPPPAKVARSSKSLTISSLLNPPASSTPSPPSPAPSSPRSESPSYDSVSERSLHAPDVQGSQTLSSRKRHSVSSRRSPSVDTGAAVPSFSSSSARTASTAPSSATAGGDMASASMGRDRWPPTTEYLISSTSQGRYSRQLPPPARFPPSPPSPSRQMQNPAYSYGEPPRMSASSSAYLSGQPRLISQTHPRPQPVPVPVPVPPQQQLPGFHNPMIHAPAPHIHGMHAHIHAHGHHPHHHSAYGLPEVSQYPGPGAASPAPVSSIAASPGVATGSSAASGAAMRIVSSPTPSPPSASAGGASSQGTTSNVPATTSLGGTANFPTAPPSMVVLPNTLEEFELLVRNAPSLVPVTALAMSPGSTQSLDVYLHSPQPQAQLALELRLISVGDDLSQFRFRDYKRKTTMDIPSDVMRALRTLPEHALLDVRLPHRISRRLYAYRLQLLAFHHVCVFGREPLFWSTLRTELLYQWLPAFARGILLDVGMQVAELRRQGVGYMEALQQCTGFRHDGLTL